MVLNGTASRWSAGCVRLSEQVGMVGRRDFGMRAQPALERVVAEAAVQDVIGGLADSGGLLGVFVRQWHCVEGRVQSGGPRRSRLSRVSLRVRTAGPGGGWPRDSHGWLLRAS